MQNAASSETRSRILIVLSALLALTTVAIAPIFFTAEAQEEYGSGLFVQTKSHDDDLPNFDIRTEKSTYKQIASLRQRMGKSAAAVADVRENVVRAEKALTSRVEGLKVAYGPHSRMPEVIGVDVKNEKQALASLSGSRVETLRQFIGQNAGLFGLQAYQAAQLTTAADYKNPEGEMSFVRLTQEINGIKVFGGEVKAGFNKRGEMIRVINNLAADVYGDVPDTFGDPASAYAIAMQNLGSHVELPRLESRRFTRDGLYRFGKDDFAPVAEKVYFPVEPGVVVPAWLVLIWQPVNAYYLVVDVESGSVLWRKNITEDQTQSATFNIWANPKAMINVADSPFPRTPGPNSTDGTQAPFLPRTLITLVGNELPYTFNNNGWITDGGNMTDGNAVEAGLDRESPDGVDPSGITVGNPSRVFDFPINPATPVVSGQTVTGDSPLPAGVNPTPCVAAGTSPAMTDFQKAAVATLFYITNRYHDEVYRLGFTEQAGNFQHDNFGRGGLGNDRVSAEAQDCSGTNNANFSTPADGTRGRMQMYIWTNTNPGIDGDLDADVIIHELTHGLSNRLHGNASGLSTNMARGMGEGWGDFFGHALLSEPTDDPNGIYTTGAYDTYRHRGVPNEYNNYYFGIRRFPKAVISSKGGPNNRPHNPLTFADIDSTQSNVSDGAFTPPITGSNNDAVHAAGEVWSSMLWEIRAKYIDRLGWEAGNRRILQHVIDGMKLSPLNPTFIDARDAIVAAALAGGTMEDVSDIWAGFALRGLGASARVIVPGTGANTARVFEAFDTPNLQQPGITVSDSVGDNDGVPEPGERVRISVPLTNLTGIPATDVWVEVVGGGSQSWGTIGHNETVSRDYNFTIPANVGCGSLVEVTIKVVSNLGNVTFTRTIAIGNPQITLSENFDGVTAPNLPAGWTAASISGGPNWVVSTLASDSAPNSVYAREPVDVGGGADLTSPSIAISDPAATLSFRHKYDTEAGWDGGLLEIKIGDGAFQDILAAGGSFLENGYTGVLGPNPGGNSPFGGRDAWSGTSGGFITTRVALPPSAAGQSVQLKWRFGSDDNTVAPVTNPGWYIDNVEVTGSYTCSFTVTGNVRADFDGDRRSDFAIYRPSDSWWWVQPSNGSTHTGIKWGTTGDIPTPGDFDGDGKTDYAIYRPNPNGQSSFWVLSSADFTHRVVNWGSDGDVPIIRDYDGDKKDDFALYRPGHSGFYIWENDGGMQLYAHGDPGDVPVAGDFDGDQIADITVFRNGTWYTRQSSTGNVVAFNWGVSTDILVPADYDNDGKDDYALFRPEDSTWWIWESSAGQHTVTQWGTTGDIPVPGDYDGDGRYDMAVFRNGVWWVRNSSGGHVAFNWGLSSDILIERLYIP